MTRLYDLDIPVLRKGGIHIKKKNRGKFTESAKRAGMGVQEYARHVLANKDKYSSTLVKRANFARNAKKFKHEDGGILKAQEGTGNLYAPHPLSPVGIALNQAKAMAKMKGEQPQQQHLPTGVKEVIGPDGQKIAIRIEQPLVSLEQSIAEWLPGTGDVVEVGYITDDVKNGNYGTAALEAGLMFIPGSVANKLLKKSDNVANVRRSFEESVQKASDFYKQPGVFEYFQDYRRSGGVGVDLDKLDRMNIETPVDAHGIAKGNHLAYLFDLLDNGVDTSRPFHSAPLFKQVDPTFGSGLGPGLGTADGKAYRDGPFIIAAKPGKTLKEDGIGTVLINDLDGGGGGLPVLIQEKLRKMYPNVDFIRYSAAPDYYKSIK